jgi:hypothetical protein
MLRLHDQKRGLGFRVEMLHLHGQKRAAVIDQSVIGLSVCI